MSSPVARAPLTDSPWFWLVLFSSVGLVFLLAIGPKYSRRQARIEGAFEAREEIARRQATGAGAAPAAEQQASPDERRGLLIPLWPLGLVLGAIWVGSLFGLWRFRLRVPGIPPVSRENQHDLAG